MVTTVTMAHPVSSLDRPKNIRCSERDFRPGFTALAGGSVLACLPFCVLAAEWDATARLNLSETYTDNLRLSAGDGGGESITQINPGFSLTGRGARLNLAADYTMQNLFYARNPESNTTYHQLKAREQSELIKDWLYFDSSASVSQQLISPGDRLPLDNLNLAGNRGDVATLKVEPYIKRELGAYASTELRYSHGWVDYDASSVSAAQSSRASGYIANGYGATQLFWRLGYRMRRDVRDNAADSKRRSTEGMMRYRMLSSFSLVGYAGQEENDIQTRRVSPDGTYWSAGFRWQPSPKFSLEATQGRNDERGRLTWSPTTRTSIDIGYRNRDVGLNTGVTWNGKISHRTRRSTWALSYLEEVTSVQVLALQDQISLFILDQEAGLAFDPESGQIIDINVFELTNEEFLRTRARGSVNYNTGKNTVSLALYDETRTYEVSAEEISTQGANASWRWRFASRTFSLVSVRAQRYEVANGSEPGDSIRTSLSLSRTMTPRTNARAEVSHLQAQAASTGEAYGENRILLRLNMSF